LVTDIINEGSEILTSGDAEIIKKTFKPKNTAGDFYIEKMMSRKKDFIPPIMKALEAA
jgi:inorganic pyrophosphatase/exopolyphosphatase